MASTNHHTEGTPHPRNGNGFESIHPEHVRQWLHFEGPVTCYSLLGITPDEAADEKCVDDAEIDRLAELAPHLQSEDETERMEAEQIAAKMREARAHLRDPQWRRAYNTWLFKKHPELIPLYCQRRTHDTVSQHLPEAAASRNNVTRPLMRMSTWVKKNPVITSVAAGVLAMMGGIMVMRQQGGASQKPMAKTEQALSEDAPELTQPQPVPPAPPEVPIATEEAAAVVPEPEKPSAVPPAIQELPAPSAEPSPEPPKTVRVPDPAPAAAPVTTPAPEQPAAVPAPPVRPPAPTDEELEPYRDVLQSPTLAGQSVEQLLEQAQKSQKPLEQWILLQIALRKARSDGRLDLVMDVLRERRSLFDDDDAVTQERIGALREAAQKKGVNVQQVMTQLSGTLRDLCADDDFMEAKRLLAMLKGRPSVDEKERADLLRLVSQLEQTHTAQGIAAHEETLASDPQNPEANKAVGAYRCFILGDWSALSLLQKSDDSELRALADRIGQRGSLSAAELLTLARDLVSVRNPAGPGAVAMAVHCLQQAEMLAPDAGILTAGIKDMHKTLLRDHAAGLSFFRGTPLHVADPASSAAPADVRVDVPSALPQGTVNLLGGDLPERFEKEAYVVRNHWKVIRQSEEGPESLEGTSGHHSWVTSAMFPLDPETQKIVRGGQYMLRFVFARTPDGVREDSFQGATAFIVPLPNGKSIPVLWDANMGKQRPGTYYSKFDPSGTPPPALHHSRPIVAENGLEHTCLVMVRTAPGGFILDAQIVGPADPKPLAQVSLTVPLTVRGAPYLLEDKPPPPDGPRWGASVGGGRIQLREAQISPWQPNKQTRSFPSAGLRTR